MRWNSNVSAKKSKIPQTSEGVRIKGKAGRGHTVAFGDIAIKALEPGKLTNQQIEAARVAIMRHIRRGGKVWIRIFPDCPITEKPR